MKLYLLIIFLSLEPPSGVVGGVYTKTDCLVAQQQVLTELSLPSACILAEVKEI